MNYLFVMIGAFWGAIARYGVSLWLGDMTFPMATITVNIIGCFLLGFLLTLVSLSRHDRRIWALTFGTGFLGAFTTFSAFALDALLLTLPMALLYIGISVVVGVIFAGAGVWTARVVYARIRKV
ncbi:MULTISPECIES: fluoride efflux transporter FluC [Oceanobacillus]|uniref:Fluoride-specific ion channel FluC n=2 Tax=Oceanobacillus TaxID=182709 RepID=A0A0A1MN01_9BACI|nr:CrcB family protein [Oceanobacillus oncorhynchi]MDM8102012.1 CrcB family protein [Oceanobacillus oncorhynchi]CEI81047.1 Putative fluoride ion transporter CrcB [Oceanobacillus oncorhynchi]